MSTDDLESLPTSALVDALLAALRADPERESDEYWDTVRTLRRRNSREVFDAAVALCARHEWIERAAGADVLSQIGPLEAGNRPFAAESAPVLMRLLSDPEPELVRSALDALGHLSAGEPEQLATLATHASANVRFALAFALGGRTDPSSIATLIALSADVDPETRDWATFALGSQCGDEDTPEIREALAARLTDANADARGEAIVGLARRRDDRCVPVLLQALAESDLNSFAVDAARLMPLPACVPDLERLEAAVPGDAAIAEAFALCRAAAGAERQ
jgi:HEAT repeat protein